MIQEALAFFEFLDSHPSFGTILQVVALIAIYGVHKSGKGGRSKLHQKIEHVDAKVGGLRSDFDVHKAVVENELNHLNGRSTSGAD